VCFVIVTSLRIVTDGNKETTYVLTYEWWRFGVRYQKSFELWVDQEAKFFQLLQPPALELWLLMAHPHCCPKLGLLYFVYYQLSSARTLVKRPLMSQQVHANPTNPRSTRKISCTDKFDLVVAYRKRSAAVRTIATTFNFNFVHILPISCHT